MSEASTAKVSAPSPRITPRLNMGYQTPKAAPNFDLDAPRRYLDTSLQGRLPDVGLELWLALTGTFGVHLLTTLQRGTFRLFAESA